MKRGAVPADNFKHNAGDLSSLYVDDVAGSAPLTKRSLRFTSSATSETGGGELADPASVQSNQNKRSFFKLIGLSEIRAIAMALPEVEEGPPVQAARRIAGFKVAGKSFLGVEKGGATITISLAEKEASAVAAQCPDAYEEIWRNGNIFMGLRVHLSKIPAGVLRDLIEKSWRHSAPKRIVTAHDKHTLQS